MGFRYAPSLSARQTALILPDIAVSSRAARYSDAMEFTILYCRPCGYHERAEQLAAERRERFEARVTVEEGGFGQFDVLLDGGLVASKGGFWKRMLTHG